MTGSRYARIFWIGAAATLVLAALIGISSLLRSDFSQTDWQILLTLLALVVSTGTAVAGLTVAERGATAIGYGAVAVAVAAFLAIAAATWSAFDDEGLAKLAAVGAFALTATLLGVTQLVLHRGRHAGLVGATAAALLLAVLVSGGALVGEADGGVWKLAASAWIVGVVGWLLLPVLQRFDAAAAAPSGSRVLATFDDVELVATRTGGLEVRLEPGERLVLRRRA